MSDNIRVAIRLRPLNEREIKNEKSLAWKTSDQKVIYQTDARISDQKYVFDRVYNCEESTFDIYEESVKDIVLSGIQGFNGTIFAYGQTSSGKTYTMSGTKSQMGIIPLAIESIFSKIDSSPDREFLLRVSYMEIYNEKITDLLDAQEKTMKMLEDENRQIVVSGLHEEVFCCGDDVIDLKKKGDARRRVAETARNEESSRSHAIFQIIIESRERQFIDEELVDECVRLSSLYFVDLAGSEKASENSGERFREGCAINKSLMSLGQVISKLSDGICNQFINYRDSKLTRLLQNGLGGNCKTAIICTINPTVVEETNSSLRFASRAKNIKNKPQINELTNTSDKAILKRYQKEIAELQKQLETFKNQTPQKFLNPYYNSLHEQEKADLEQKYQSVITKLKSMICVSNTSPAKKKIIRRETWCPGVRKRKLEQISHIPTFKVMPPSIVEESCSPPESHENTILPKAPLILANSSSQTERTAETDNTLLLKMENEMLRNQIAMVSNELSALKAIPVKQRRVSFESHDETKEFLELELQLAHEIQEKAREKDFHMIEEEKKLDMERRRFKEECIKRDKSVRAFEAEKKQLMQRVASTEGENSCLLTNLERSQERVKNLEQELTCLQNQFATTANSRRSMDRPLLNMSNITDRSKRTSCKNCLTLKEQMFSLQSEVQLQETEIQKVTRDLEKCKEQLKNKFDEVRFLSVEMTELKERLEILQLENTKMTQTLEDKTPVCELPEVIDLKSRLSEVTHEKQSLQQKLKTKSEELTYLSRQSAVYLEQIESKNVNSSVENREESKEIESITAKLAALEAEKSQVLQDLNTSKLYCDSLKDHLKLKTDECLLLQKNLNATHEEVVTMRKTLVEIRDQLLAKEELILELSQIKPADVSSQQSLLKNSLNTDYETVDCLQEQLQAKSNECENLSEKPQDLAEKKSESGDDIEDGKEAQEDLFVKLSAAEQENVVLEERYKQLMEERDGMELCIAEQAKELGTLKQSLTEMQKCLEEIQSETRAQLEVLRETVTVREGECACLSEELTRTKQELADSISSNKEKQISLKAEAEAQSADLAKLQQQLVIIEQNHEHKLKECLELNEQVSSLTEKLVQNSEKQNQLEKVESQHQKCLEPAENLRLVPELTEQKKNALDEDSKDSDSDAEIVFQTPSNEADITLLDSLREELDAKREECSRLQKFSNVQEYEVLQQELKNLELENKNLKSAHTSMKGQIAELKAEKRCQEDLMNSLRKEFEEKSQDYEIISGEMKTLQMENQNKNSACMSLSEKLLTLKQEKATSEEFLESLRMEFNAKEDEFEFLKKELENFKENGGAECKECKKLEEEIFLLKSKNLQKMAPLDDQIDLCLEEVRQSPDVVNKGEPVETDFEINEEDTTIDKPANEKQELDSLNAELRAKTEECNALSAQLQQMTEKNILQHSTPTTGANNEELTLCKHQLEDKIEECCQLQRELSNIQDDYQVLKMSLEELQDYSQLADSSLHNHLSECQADLESKTKECMCLGRQLSEMEREISSKTNECNNLNKKTSTLEEVLSSKTEESIRLTERLKALEEALKVKNEASISELQQNKSNEVADSVQQSMSDSFEDKSLELHEELKQLREQYHLKTSECEQLSRQVNELKNNYEELESSLAEETLKRNSLIKELGMVKSDMARLEAERNQLNQNNNVSDNRTGPLDDNRQTLTEALEIKTQNCLTLSREMDNLKEELEKLKMQKDDEVQRMRHSIEELEAKSLDYDILVEEIKRSSFSLTDPCHKNKELHEELVKKTAELEEMKEENACLVSAVQQEQENLAGVRVELAESLSELDNMHKECSSLKKDLTEINSKTNSLQKSLCCAQEKEQLMAQQLIARSAKCEQLTEELASINKECERLKMSLLSLDEENNRLSGIQKDLHVTQNNLEAKVDECLMLTQQVESLKVEMESLKVSLLDMNDVNQQLVASKERMISLQAELDTKTEDNAQLLEEVIALRDQRQNIQDSVTVKEAEILVIQKELESKLSDLAELKEQFAHLKKKLSDVEMENTSLRDSLLKLDEQNDQLSMLNDCLVINKKDLDAKSEECALLSAELETAKAFKLEALTEVEGKLESKTEECLKLAKEVSALKEEVSSVEEKSSQELMNKCEEYALLSVELATEKESKMKMLEAMQTKLSAKVEECISLSDQVAILENLHKDALANLEKELSEKFEQCNSLSTELSELLQKHSDLERLLSTKESLELENKEKLKSLKEESENLKDKLKTEEEKVRTLTSQLESCVKPLEYKEGICKFPYENNQSIKTEIYKSKDQTESQNNSINNSTVQKTEFVMSYLNCADGSMQQSGQTQEMKDSSKLVIKKLKCEIIELKDKLDDLEGQAGLCKVLQDDVKSQREIIETLSAENAKKAELISKMKIQDSGVSKENSERLAKLQNELKEKSTKCRELSEQLKTVQTDLSNTKAQLKKIKLEKIELSETMEMLEGKADLCEVYANENKENELKLKELEEEKLETTRRLTELETEIENKPDLTEMTQQLQKALEENGSHKSVVKKLKIERIELKDKIEDLEGPANLCQVLLEEIKSHQEKIETLSTENAQKAELISKLKIQDSSVTNENLEGLAKLQNELKEKSTECRELSEQLKMVQTDLSDTKAQLKKIQLEKVELLKTMETLEGKANLCELYANENREKELKLKELEEEKLETTRKLTELETEIERKPEITEDLTEMTQQLQKALEEKDFHRSMTKKLKIEKLELKDTLEDLEGKANLCEILQEEIQSHLNKIKTLSSDNENKDEIIKKFEIDVREKQECIRMLETRTFSDLKAQELKSLQQQLSNNSMNLVWAQSNSQIEKAQFVKKIKSYEETIDILHEKIKSLKEELRLLQTQKDETVKVPSIECKRTQSDENTAMQSHGFIDDMACITLEAENSKLKRKIENLKQKLGNAFKKNEEMKRELQAYNETAEKENTPSKQRKVAEKYTNTETPKLSEYNAPTESQLADKNTPDRLKPHQAHNQNADKAECNNQ